MFISSSSNKSVSVFYSCIPVLLTAVQAKVYLHM